MYWGARRQEAETACSCCEVLRRVLVRTVLYTPDANAAQCFVYRDIGCICLCALGPAVVFTVSDLYALFIPSILLAGD